MGAGEREGRESVEGEREGGKLDSDDWRCGLGAVGVVMVVEEGGGGRWTCTEAIVWGRGQESSDAKWSRGDGGPSRWGAIDSRGAGCWAAIAPNARRGGEAAGYMVSPSRSQWRRDDGSFTSWAASKSAARWCRRAGAGVGAPLSKALRVRPTLAP